MFGRGCEEYINCFERNEDNLKFVRKELILLGLIGWGG